jgi:hypothetical protein
MKTIETQMPSQEAAPRAFGDEDSPAGYSPSVSL